MISDGGQVTGVEMEKSYANFKVPFSPEQSVQKHMDNEKCFVYIQEKINNMDHDARLCADNEMSTQTFVVENMQQNDETECGKVSCLVVSGTDVFSDTDPPQTDTYLLNIKDTSELNNSSSGDTRCVNGHSVPQCDNDIDSKTSPSPENDHSLQRPSEKSDRVTSEQSTYSHEEPSTKTRRSNRKRSLTTKEVFSVTCPLCGKSLRTDQLSSHVETELCKLEKMTHDKLTRHRKTSENYRKLTETLPSVSSSEDHGELMDSSSRYKSYLTVRTRRERRSLTKKKKTPGPGEQETKCPVCNETIVGTDEELADHVDQCLVQQEEEGSAELDVEGDDGGFEEYTWAGQTRIRAISLVEGGLAASGFQTTRLSNTEEEEDLDLDVDGDDCQLYGNAQYTEADLLPCRSEEPDDEKERKALRNAVIRGEGSRVSRVIPSDRQRWSQNGTNKGDKRIQKNSDENGSSSAPSSEEIDCLKAKIRDQAAQLDKLERPKCLICMDWYTTPLVSVQCWHVHCEECWLRTLGTKKLCPQCNMITSPNDLRKIYL